MSCIGDSRAKVWGALLLFSLLSAGCSCSSNATPLTKKVGGAGGTGGEPDGGMGGFFDPGFGGHGGEAAGGAGGGEGGAGGETPQPSACDRVCSRLEDLCDLKVPGLDQDCPRQCEQSLLEEEKICLAAVKCSMAEVDHCLGREPPDPEPEPEGHRCEELCPFVYDQCGRTMKDGIGLSIHPADCEARCPHLPDPYLDCLEAATNCPAVDACYEEPPHPPPTACEQMCEHVYDTCGSSIAEPGRSYPSRQSCEAACGRGDLTNQEIQCLTHSACPALPSCFPKQGLTPCEELCDRVYGECHNAFPIGAHKDDKMDEEACVEACENGEITASERACLEQESCEYAATCFYPALERSCASACYWVHAWCGLYVQLQRLVLDPYTSEILQFDYPFESESECHDLCQYGFVSNDPPWVAPKEVPAWSSGRKTCYRDRASPMEPLECDQGDGHPYGMNYCAMYDPQ